MAAMIPETIKSMRLKPDPRVAAREIDSQIFAVTPFDWQLHRFNEVATRIWQLAEQQCTVSEIIDTLVKEFDAEPETVESDCIGFIALLEGKGLVELIGV